MSKPDDIPQDVWEASRAAFGTAEDPYCDIARAIMAERERCAMRIEQHRDWVGGYRFPQEVRRLIAAKIRKGDQP